MLWMGRRSLGMLDCRRVDALILRFPQREIPDLLLSQGVHAIGLDKDRQPTLAADPAMAAVQLCVDRRGVWLQVCEQGSRLHVNGRAIRRMAMLRGGDSIYLEGVEMLLLGTEPLPVPPDNPPAARHDNRAVLRGVGGRYHGHCYNLGAPITIGRTGECAIRVDDMDSAERHAQLEPHAEGVVLRDLGTGDGSIVNGHRVRDALLRAGDQVVFAAHRRFVVEAPTRVAAQPPLSLSPDDDGSFDGLHGADARGARPVSVRRMPWLLLAAVLLAGALALLLLYGAR